MEREMATEDNVRLYITVSKYNYRKLKEWARIHGKPPSTFAGQIVATNLESNLDTIEKQKQDLAHYEGISADELQKRWEGEGESD